LPVGELMNDEQKNGSGKRIRIAIDGPAGAGKSTLAKRVADELSYLYIDTGAMYRAATWIALEHNCDLNNHEAVIELLSKSVIELIPDGKGVRVIADGTDVSLPIRSHTVTRSVSTISAIAGVRKIMVQKQRGLSTAGGVVMDGRDIGTVVLPDSELKIFLTASPEVRAQRRLKDMVEIGQIADLDTIIRDIKQRDHVDSTRTASPLKQADDAILIDTDNYTLDQVCQIVLDLCRQRI
jgi:CMP/dCMP kinase